MARLALAVAQGQTVTSWANENDVVPRTARSWARTPEFKGLVASHRQAIVDRTVGRLTKHATKAVETIAKLMKSGENDGVKLNAAKALLDKLMEVGTYVESARQVSELEARLKILEAPGHATVTTGETD